MSEWTPHGERWTLELSDPSEGFNCFHIMCGSMVVTSFDGPQSDARQMERAFMATAAPGLYEALASVMRDIEEYELANKLHPNPGKQDCWQSVTAARAALAKARVET